MSAPLMATVPLALTVPLRLSEPLTVMLSEVVTVPSNAAPPTTVRAAELFRAPPLLTVTEPMLATVEFTVPPEISNMSTLVISAEAVTAAPLTFNCVMSSKAPPPKPAVPPVRLTVSAVRLPPVTSRLALEFSVVALMSPADTRLPVPETFTVDASIAPPVAAVTVPSVTSSTVLVKAPVAETAAAPPLTETEPLRMVASTFRFPLFTVVDKDTSRALATTTVPPSIVRLMAPRPSMWGASTETEPLLTIMLPSTVGPEGAAGSQLAPLQLPPTVPSHVRVALATRNTLSVSYHALASLQSPAPTSAMLTLETGPNEPAAV